MSMETNKLKQLRVFQEDTKMSLQSIIDKAYQTLGNPIILYDIDWNVLAYPEGVTTDDPFWNNHIITGTISNNIDAYINEGFVDIITGPDRVVLLSSKKVKYRRFFGKIFDEENLPIAGISVVACNKPFGDDDLKITESICKALSREIRKIPYYQNYAQKKLETYINMLIGTSIRDIKDKLYVSGYIEMIYKGLKSNLYLAVADISQCDPTYAKLDYYRDLFKRTRPAFKYSVYSNYIVIVMSTDEGIFYPKRCFNLLYGLFEENNITVGISSRFENLFELKKYYAQAVNALDKGLKSNSSQRIFFT